MAMLESEDVATPWRVLTRHGSEIGRAMHVTFANLIHRQPSLEKLQLFEAKFTWLDEILAEAKSAFAT